MVEAKVVAISKLGGDDKKKKGFEDLIAASSVDDMIGIVVVCVSENITKADAKIALNCLADRLEKISSDDCEKFCTAAETKMQAKRSLFENEV